MEKGGGINVPVTLELLVAPGESNKVLTKMKGFGIWCQMESQAQDKLS